MNAAISRRQFLTRAVGRVAAAALLPTIEAFRARGEPAAWDATYAAAHHWALRCWTEQMQARGFSVDRLDPEPGRRIGSRFREEGPVFAHHLSVATSPEDREQAVAPAMCALADRAAFWGLEAYAALPTRMPGCAYANTLGPLRMIVAWPLGFAPPRDVRLLRFDVLGGSSPEGQRQARRCRAQDLKRSIRRRRATRPRVVSPLPA